jgi:hypothetical protein
VAFWTKKRGEEENTTKNEVNFVAHGVFTRRMQYRNADTSIRKNYTQMRQKHEELQERRRKSRNRWGGKLEY